MTAAGVPSFGRPEVAEHSDAHAVLVSRGERGGIVLEATTRIEYDGMIHVRLRLVPQKATTLRSLSYAFSLPSDSIECDAGSTRSQSSIVSSIECAMPSLNGTFAIASEKPAVAGTAYAGFAL